MSLLAAGAKDCFGRPRGLLGALGALPCDNDMYRDPLGGINFYLIVKFEISVGIQRRMT